MGDRWVSLAVPSLGQDRLNIDDELQVRGANIAAVDSFPGTGSEVVPVEKQIRRLQDPGQHLVVLVLECDGQSLLGFREDRLSKLIRRRKQEGAVDFAVGPARFPGEQGKGHFQRAVDHLQAVLSKVRPAQGFPLDATGVLDRIRQGHEGLHPGTFDNALHVIAGGHQAYNIGGVQPDVMILLPRQPEEQIRVSVGTLHLGLQVLRDLRQLVRAGVFRVEPSFPDISPASDHPGIDPEGAGRGKGGLGQVLFPLLFVLPKGRNLFPDLFLVEVGCSEILQLLHPAGILVSCFTGPVLPRKEVTDGKPESQPVPR